MKLSKNFLKDYIDIDVDIKTLAEDMTKVGNEYDSAQKLINATRLVIGEIIECENHPDSDHLHVCKVDIKTEVLQIVCGAPNARKGIKVIVAQVGAELPEITIKKGTIRGIESNGMMCSLEELGIEKKFLKEEEKQGICELSKDAQIGEEPTKFLGLDDEIIDFELTANRGDLLSILGMAYEVGAIYNRKVKDINLVHNENDSDINKSFNLEIKTDNCSIFLAKKVENVIIKESPQFIKNRLIASGIRPINNVVDISNYVMLEVGQPLHFYDSDKLDNNILVRMAKENEKLETLDGNQVTLCENDIVITDGKKVIGLAGVMGGRETEVTQNTKNIIIESAIFDSVKVRVTSKKIIRSEASNRFEKGIDPNRTYMAVERACHLLEKYADAKIIQGIAKYDKTNKESKKIKIECSNINNVLGIEIPKKEVVEVFLRLGFQVEEKEEFLNVYVPKRRLDINIKEDLIEEVGRIYGLDNIQGKLPILEMKAGKYDKTTREIRNKMINLGLNETLTYSLVNQNEVKKYSNEEFDIIKLLDPMTEERNSLRNSIISSLIKVYEYNLAHNVKDVSIFEIGKGFYKKERFYEENKLGCLMSGKYYLGIENTKEVDFYIIKGVAEEILNYLGYENRYSFITPKNVLDSFHPWQTAEISVNGDIVGIIGRIHPSIIKEKVFVLEINLERLLAKKVSKMKFKEISKYPNIKKDLAFIVNKDVEAKAIEIVIKKSGGSLLKNIEIFDVYTGENVKKDEKSIAYSLTFNDEKKTLKEEEITIIFNKIIEEVEKKCNAKLRN